MQILLTGGTGFIGSNFINAAYAAGHEIICLRRQSSRSRIVLKIVREWTVAELDG